MDRILGRLLARGDAPARRGVRWQLGSGPRLPRLQPALSHGITPATLQEGELLALLHQVGFVPRAQGTTTIATTKTLPSGDRIEVPCDDFLFQRAAG